MLRGEIWVAATAGEICRMAAIAIFTGLLAGVVVVVVAFFFSAGLRCFD